MSKTRGKHRDPDQAADEFGVDGVRYVVLREVPFDRDADVTFEGFVRRYNADLANDLGNLVNRTVSMSARYLEGVLPAPSGDAAADRELRAVAERVVAAYHDSFGRFQLHAALASMMELAGAANGYAESQAPWTVHKGGDLARVGQILSVMAEACRLIGHMLAPVAPSGARAIHEQLGTPPPYDDRGAGGPGLGRLLAWGAAAGERACRPTCPCRSSRASSWRPRSLSRRVVAERLAGPGRLALSSPARALRLDRDAVIERAVAAGIERILVPGWDVASSEAALELAERHAPVVVAGVGVHPHDAGAMDAESWRRLETLAKDARCAAVGEIGLDFFRNLFAARRAAEAFARQLELAAERNLPVLVHCREAHADVTDALLAWRGRAGSDARGALHAFSGDAAMATTLAAAGFLISFALPVAFRSATGPRAAAAALPGRRAARRDRRAVPRAGPRGPQRADHCAARRSRAGRAARLDPGIHRGRSARRLRAPRRGMTVACSVGRSTSVPMAINRMEAPPTWARSTSTPPEAAPPVSRPAAAAPA